MTQSTLSRRIQTFEEELGVRLFNRSRGLEPTEYGRLVLSRGRGIVADVDELKHTLDQMRGLEIGKLTIAVGQFVARTWIGDAVARILQTYAGLEIRINEEEWWKLKPALHERDVEIAVGDLGDPGAEDEIVFEPLPKRQGFFAAAKITLWPGTKRCRLKSFALSRLPHQNSRPPWPRGFRLTSNLVNSIETCGTLCRGFAHLIFTRHCASSHKPTPSDSYCRHSPPTKSGTAALSFFRLRHPGQSRIMESCTCAGECCRLPRPLSAQLRSPQSVTISQEHHNKSAASKDCVEAIQKIEALAAECAANSAQPRLSRSRGVHRRADRPLETTFHFHCNEECRSAGLHQRAISCRRRIMM